MAYQMLLMQHKPETVTLPQLGWRAQSPQFPVPLRQPLARGRRRRQSREWQWKNRVGVRTRLIAVGVIPRRVEAPRPRRNKGLPRGIASVSHLEQGTCKMI